MCFTLKSSLNKDDHSFMQQAFFLSSGITLVVTAQCQFIHLTEELSQLRNLFCCVKVSDLVFKLFLFHFTHHQLFILSIYVLILFCIATDSLFSVISKNRRIQIGTEDSGGIQTSVLLKTELAMTQGILGFLQNKPLIHHQLIVGVVIIW